MHDYDELLHQLGSLRANGVSESDNRIIRLRMRLRDLLDSRKKYRKDTGPLPTVTAMQTVKLNKTLGETADYKKYALVGAALGITYVVFRLVTNFRA